MIKEVKLPILRKLVSESSKYDCIPTIAIQHLKPDTYQFFKELKNAGFEPVIISGIEYSTDPEVLKQLEEDGYKITNPKNTELFKPEYWDKFVGNELKKWKSEKQEYIILEDGGYIGTTFHKSRKIYLKTCRGAVEQTANGYWKYKELERTGDLSIPVFTVANSRLKELVEAPEVGLAIAKSLEQNLDKLNDSVNHKTIMILGFGSIGKTVANALKGRNLAELLIFDSDSVKLMEAHFNNFKTIQKEEGLQKADIVIGCTGRQSLDPEDYDLIKDGVILANGTSKKVEFDMQWLTDNSKNTKTKGKIIDFEILSKKITVLAKGEPINFEANVSVSPETIDIIISEMFVCMQRIMKGGLENKVYTISIEDEQKISNLWLEFYRN